MINKTKIISIYLVNYLVILPCCYQKQHYAMQSPKQDIVTSLQKSLLALQGFKQPVGNGIDVGVGAIKYAFPNSMFPTGAVHELLCNTAETGAATGGFVSGILAALMQNGGVCVWVSQKQMVFPLALKAFGIEPCKVIFITLQKEKDILWVMEEALKCPGLAAVVGEVQQISFTASRRLQLAVEESRVTGFIIRNTTRNLNTIACIARWKITPLQSELEDGMPGVGLPRFNVQLLKVRNGKPGIWQVGWHGCFIVDDQQKQTIWLNAMLQYGSAI